MESKTAQVIQLINDGNTARETAEDVGCHLMLVYQTARRYGLKIAEGKGNTSECEPYDSDIRNMKAIGLTNGQVADALHISKTSVENYCKKRRITTAEASKHGTHTEQEVASIVQTKAPELEYVGGYINNATPMRVRCRICGTEFERTLSGIATKGNTSCPECMRREAQARQTAKRRAKAEARRKKERERRQRREKKQAQIGMNFCPVCGAPTLRRKYCSDKCSAKAHNKAKDTRRRQLISAAMVDKDITVEGLYKRDNGICYLCGKPCRLDDYIIQDGQKQCGDWYPSIDHVVPLARGGAHSWDNVKLAHRICNSRKADSLIKP